MKPYHPKTEARKQLAILYDMFLLARKLAVYSRLDQMDEFKKIEEAIKGLAKEEKFTFCDDC